MSDPREWFYVRDDQSARRLIDLLNPAVLRLREFGLQPALVAEAPHKFNDANYDDYWCAVQFGGSYWEQSQYFEHIEHQGIKETASYVPDQTIDPKSTGTSVSSARIETLRTLLRDLQAAKWRDHIADAISPSPNLKSLALEYGQPWLCLEEVNGAGEDHVISWDDEGFFLVGSIERLDQAIGRPQIVLFDTLVSNDLHRLGAAARSYFLPEIRDAAALTLLHRQLVRAIDIVRAQTDQPVALRAAASRSSATELNRRPMFSQPESFTDGLRNGEGQYRVMRDGLWPKMRTARMPSVEYEMSDLAKACNLAARVLHDGGWRAGLAQALGEPLARGETVALFVDGEHAVLTRDNSYFDVSRAGIALAGAFDYPSCWAPEQTLGRFRAGSQYGAPIG